MPAQVASGTLARGQVVHRQHGVRLAAAECRLELNNRIAAFTVQPLGHLRQQQSHPFRDVGALEERDRRPDIPGVPCRCEPP